MRKNKVVVLFGLVLVLITACGKKIEDSRDSVVRNSGEQIESEVPGQTMEIEAEKVENSSEMKIADDNDSHILIAYFSRVGNTDFPKEIDAVSSASLILKDGEIYGNTQYIASLIQKHTGGELFLIETEEKYPTDYDETDEQGEKENRERTRPKLASHIRDVARFDTIFLGFPDWYYDMPMAVYTFLEEYDFSGKRIIPFVTSGGSGFSNSIAEIEKLQPGAEVVRDGFEVTHFEVEDVKAEDIGEWIAGLNL